MLYGADRLVGSWSTRGGAADVVARKARRMARSPSTIPRELRRDAATRSGLLHYRGTVAIIRPRPASAVSSRMPRAARFRGLMSCGRADVIGRVLTGAGAPVGVRSRSVAACGLTSDAEKQGGQIGPCTLDGFESSTKDCIALSDISRAVFWRRLRLPC